MSVSQAPGVFPAPALTGPCPTLEVLNAYSEQATQLEVWLERAQHTLGVLERAATASMQDSVEQQLLTCQVRTADGCQSSALWRTCRVGLYPGTSPGMVVSSKDIRDASVS